MLNVESPLAHHSDEPHQHAGLQDLMRLVVDQVDSGLLVCDFHGHILHANRAATRELNTGQVLKAEDGVLHGTGTSAKDLVAAILDAGSRGRRKLVSLGGDPRLTAIIVPLEVPTVDRVSLVLVMMGRRTICTPLGLELLAIQHRLTLTEQRVFRALLDGDAARDIVEAHGVAMSTVRTQIQSLRDKLGVGTIEGLLHAAARVPPVPSCH